MAVQIPGYREVRIGEGQLLVHEEALPVVEGMMAGGRTLYDFAAGASDREVIQGREEVYLLSVPSAPRWLVRRLTHGGVLAPLTRGWFLRLGLPRPFNEVRLSYRARQLGLPTPRVPVAAIYPRGPFYQGEIAREEVKDARDLADCLFAPPALPAADRLAVLSAAGGLVARLHHALLQHVDLNLRNILMTRSEGNWQAHIIDLEKCRFRLALSQRDKQRMVARLQRSARRFAEAGNRRLAGSEWQAFDDGYAEGERA